MPDAGRLIDEPLPRPDSSTSGAVVDITVPNGELWYVEQFELIVSDTGERDSASDYTLSVVFGIQKETTNVVDTFNKTRVQSNQFDVGDELDAQEGELIAGRSVGDYVYENERVAVVEQTDTFSVSGPGQLTFAVFGRRVLP